MNKTYAAILLAALALAGTACGSTGQTKAAQPAANDTTQPATVYVQCSDILRAGAHIPASWDGSCEQANGDLMATPLFDCSNQRALYGNDNFWGWAGDTMHKSSYQDVGADPAYKQAYSQCNS